MTERLYYDDAYTHEFDAIIVERTEYEGSPAVVLDRSYFYPSGGGQPADHGTINDVPVIDTQTRAEDKAILHIMAGPVNGDSVHCMIDWSRRFDHMQQHTGQHLLTQAFVSVANANTVGFHLSAETVTIDLDIAELSPEHISEVELLANQIVQEDRPVITRTIDPDTVDDAGVRMRKMPENLLTDGLRVVEIENFDQTACGGTHVSRTGEIGQIKIIKTERRGEKLRVEFRCGGRALRDYQAKNSITNSLSAALTCHQDELVEAVLRMQEELKQALRQNRAMKNELLAHEVEALLQAGAAFGRGKLIRAAFEDRDKNELQGLATRLTSSPATIALLGTTGEKAHFVFACSEGSKQDMNALIKRVLPILGDARGGGRPNLAQGGGVKADLVQVEMVLNEAARALKE